MAEPTEGRDPESDLDGQPGGRSSRGPNPDPGGEEQPGGLVPPYDDRTSGTETASKQARAESVERQLGDVGPGAHGSTSSPADEQPVSDEEVTSRTPESAKGVGVSTTRRGEDMVDDDGEEPGRHDEGTDQAGRPVGTSDERDSSAVAPQDAQGDAPTLPAGDQGG